MSLGRRRGSGPCCPLSTERVELLNDRSPRRRPWGPAAPGGSALLGRPWSCSKGGPTKTPTCGSQPPRTCGDPVPVTCASSNPVPVSATLPENVTGPRSDGRLDPVPAGAPDRGRGAMTTARRYGGTATGIVDRAADEDAVPSAAVEIAQTQTGLDRRHPRHHQEAHVRLGPGHSARRGRPARLTPFIRAA